MGGGLGVIWIPSTTEKILKRRECVNHVRPMSLYQQFVIMKAISIARNLPISLLFKVSSILLIS